MSKNYFIRLPDTHTHVHNDIDTSKLEQKIDEINKNMDRVSISLEEYNMLKDKSNKFDQLFINLRKYNIPLSFLDESIKKNVKTMTDHLNLNIVYRIEFKEPLYNSSKR